MGTNTETHNRKSAKSERPRDTQFEVVSPHQIPLSGAQGIPEEEAERVSEPEEMGDTKETRPKHIRTDAYELTQTITAGRGPA